LWTFATRAMSTMRSSYSTVGTSWISAIVTSPC
jgi:hypothetical protein